jgi:alpha-tubulin suppressor-like RCC1 family protein
MPGRRSHPNGKLASPEQRLKQKPIACRVLSLCSLPMSTIGDYGTGETAGRRDGRCATGRYARAGSGDKKHLTPVKLSFTDVTTLAGAGGHATYDSDGTLYSCGTDQYGELGDGSTTSSMTPVRVSLLDGALVTTLVAAWRDTGALLSDGDYYDWGYNAGGQVGDGGTTSVTTPFRVPLDAAVTQVALGGSASSNGQTLAMLTGGTLWAWGDGKAYQLGNGAKGNEESPIHITPPTGVTYVALATGGATSYGITRDGDVWAWGYNKNGEVGNGTTKAAQEPVEVATDATQVSATARDVVIATTNG